MSQINIFRTIPLSFFSREFYREVGEKWRGRAFAYLLLILALCWIVVSLLAVGGVSKFLDMASSQLIPQIPTLTFSEGSLLTQNVKPTLIKTKKGEVVAIIDSNDAIKNLDKVSATVIFQKNALYIKDYNEVKKYNYPKQYSGVVTQGKILRVLHRLKKWILLGAFILFYLIGLAVSYIYRTVQSLLYAVIGMIFAALLRKKINYGAMLNLTIVAMTPAIILKLILMVGAVHLPLLWVVYVALTFFYLFYAIKSSAT